jgi:hypothetical protein
MGPWCKGYSDEAALFWRGYSQIYNEVSVLCPLCRGRKARRACPALGQEICAICCATKRLTEIACPSDCGYLAAARDHPSAAVVRRQQRDLGVFLPLVRDFSERQSELFVVLATLLRSYRPTGLDVLVDDDVSEALGALASTLETAARGVIYEHRPASGPAIRLVAAMRSALADDGAPRPSGFDRDAAVVLRRLESAAVEARKQFPGERRAFLDLLGRVFSREQTAVEPAQDEAPRLIVP